MLTLNQAGAKGENNPAQDDQTSRREFLIRLTADSPKY